MDEIHMAMIDSAAEFIRSRWPHKPTCGIVCGSGLGTLADRVQDPVRIPYEEIPHFAKSTVPGHSGVLVGGKIGNCLVCVMQGRLHPYEGHTYLQCTFPVRVLAKLGVTHLVLTNAAGGLRKEFEPGDIMNVRDHINFPGFSGHSPLSGLSPEVFGERFLTLSNAYDKGLRNQVAETAKKLDIKMHTGVYCMLGGPHYETPAECRILALLGADAVGMSTVHETIVARQCKMKVIGLSIITNVCQMDSDSHESDFSLHLEVVKASEKAANSLSRLITEFVAGIR